MYYKKRERHEDAAIVALPEGTSRLDSIKSEMIWSDCECNGNSHGSNGILGPGVGQ